MPAVFACSIARSTLKRRVACRIQSLFDRCIRSYKPVYPHLAGWTDRLRLALPPNRGVRQSAWLYAGENLRLRIVGRRGLPPFPPVTIHIYTYARVTWSVRLNTRRGYASPTRWPCRSRRVPATRPAPAPSSLSPAVQFAGVSLRAVARSPRVATATRVSSFLARRAVAPAGAGTL